MRTCNTCGCKLSDKNSPEAMMEEFKEKICEPYGLSADADMIVVCDDCYEAHLVWIKEVGAEQLRKWEDEAKADGSFKQNER